MGSKAGDEAAIMILGDNIKKYRTEAKLSIRALATAALLSPSQISRIEAGEINTSVSTIFAIAEALGIEPSKLLEK
jgi:transcriptional regulator with XRE-family HTH domain